MTETQKGAVLASQHCDLQHNQMTQGREVHAELSVLKNTKNICCPSFASTARMFGAAFLLQGGVWRQIFRADCGLGGRGGAGQWSKPLEPEQKEREPIMFFVVVGRAEQC